MLLPSARVPPAPNTRSPCLFYSTSIVGRLPNEVWIHVLESLPVPSILLCRQLCRKIKYIIDQTARLQYPIELFATGHVDGGPSNSLSTAARLTQLRAIDRGWRTLEWKSHLHYPWNGDCPNYELAGGVFARGRSTLPDAGQPDADDFHHFTAAIDVIVFPPRDGEKGEDAKSWSHEQVGLLVHDFTIAPEQDLVVLVGHRHEGAVEEPIPIHLRALSSNTPHPLATLPILFAHPQPTDVFISDFTIQIYDSLLGILFWGAHAFHLMIWDWCSGEIIVDYAAPAGIHFDDFTFLSSSSFLIPSSSAAGAALRVYSFAHLLPPSHPSLSSSSYPSSSDTASSTTPKTSSTSSSSTSSPLKGYRPNYDHLPLGRAPHHLEFDNSGRRVAPACWTPPRPDGVVRSFHIGNYVFSVSNLEDWREGTGSSRSSSEAGTSSSGANGSGGGEGSGGSGNGAGGVMGAPAGLNGLSRRPQLCSLLKFPKPRREWNVGIMTCRVDPLPRFGMDQSRRRRSEGEGKARDNTSGEVVMEEYQEDEGTRLAPVRAFHADPDKAIIALSSGLVPVRTGVFAGVVYLDEGSLAWEEGGGDGGDEGDVDEGDEQPAGETSGRGDRSRPPLEPTQPAPPPPTAITSHPVPTSSLDPPPPLTTLVPWIDLHMPPSSLPAPADPPIMSVFDHSSAGSGHTPIQIQIHDAIIGEDGVPVGAAGGYAAETAAPAPNQAGTSTGLGTTAGQVAAGVAPTPGAAAAGPSTQAPLAPVQPAPNPLLTGPDAPVPAPFTTALPFPAVPQVAEDDPNVDDMDRLYFNLFVHCRALRRFAEEESTETGGTLSEPAIRPEEVRADTSRPNGRIRPYRPRVYEWDDWAPPITRLLARMPMPAWACISHGQRFATLGVGAATMNDVGGTGTGTIAEGVAGIGAAGGGVNVPGPANAAAILNINGPDPNWLVDGGPGGTNVKRPVRVLDFNPYGVRRSKGKGVESSRNRVKIVDEPSVLAAGRYWQADVRSELPYREVVTREEMLLSGVMIDGERVLGMRSDERGNVSEMHVMQV